MSVYTPYITNITDITQSPQAVVTVVETVPYSIGEIVSFRVSKPYGMAEANNLSAKVLGVTSNTVMVDLNTSSFTAFIYPPIGEVVYPALLVPSASGVIPNSPVPMTNLQDCFDNVPTT